MYKNQSSYDFNGSYDLESNVPDLYQLIKVAQKPTPQGEPSVAAQKLMEAGIPMQEMGAPPAMPEQQVPPEQQMPPQQGLPQLLKQADLAAPTVAQNMQEQQTAQMMAQAQPQPQMMAEGGIASLPIDDYEYADGGIIGYAAGGEFDLGDSEEARLRDEERVRLIKERQREEQKRLTAEMLGRPYDLPQQVAAPKPISPARFETDSTDPIRRINQLATILKNDQTLDPENRTRIAQEINQLYAQISAAPQDRQPIAAPPEAGIPSALPPQRASSALSDLFSKREKELGKMRMPEEKTPQQIAQQRMEYLRSMGLPTDAGAAEEARLKELEAFDAETRAGIPGRQKAQMQNALLQGILNPKRQPMHLGHLFAETGSAIGNEEERIARESEVARGRQREQMIAMSTARRALDMAKRQEALGDYAGAEASRATANAAFNKMQEAKIDLLGKQVEVTSAGERAAELPANMQELRFALENPAAYEKAIRAKAGTAPADRQDLAELKSLQTNLTSQLENLSLPAPRRAQLQGMLDQVTARLATMSGLEPAPANRIRFDAQGNQIK